MKIIEMPEDWLPHVPSKNNIMGDSLAIATADIVIHRGQIIKHRHGNHGEATDAMIEAAEPVEEFIARELPNFAKRAA